MLIRIVCIAVCVFLFTSTYAFSEYVNIRKTIDADGIQVIMDGNVYVPNVSILSNYIVQTRNFNPNQLARDMWPKRQDSYCVRQNEEDGSVEVVWPNGDSLFVSSGIISYQASQALPTYKNPSYFLDGTQDNYSKVELTESEALEQAYAFLDRIGIKDLRLVKAYSFDQETLTRLHGEKRMITEQDEGYYFFFHITEHDVALLPHIRTSVYHNYLVYGSGVEITVTGAGIQYFATAAGCSLYDVIESGGEEYAIHTVDEALEAVAGKYSQIILLEPVRINEAGLYYVVEPMAGGKMQQYTLTPAWVFYNRIFHEESGTWLDSDPICIIDAITLEEIH